MKALEIVEAGTSPRNSCVIVDVRYEGRRMRLVVLDTPGWATSLTDGHVVATLPDKTIADPKENLLYAMNPLAQYSSERGDLDVFFPEYGGAPTKSYVYWREQVRNGLVLKLGTGCVLSTEYRMRSGR